MFRRCVLFFALPPSPSEITKALGTLGVTMDTVADEKMLKKAYRELVKKHHPDTGGDAEKIKSINLAHDLLLGLSPHERRAYLENKRNNQNPFERMSSSYAHTGQRRPTPDTGPGGAFYSADAAYDWRAMYQQQQAKKGNPYGYRAPSSNHEDLRRSDPNPFSSTNMGTSFRMSFRDVLVRMLVVYFCVSALFAIMYRWYKENRQMDGWDQIESMALHDRIGNLENAREAYRKRMEELNALRQRRELEMAAARASQMQRQREEQERMAVPAAFASSGPPRDPGRPDLLPSLVPQDREAYPPLSLLTQPATLLPPVIKGVIYYEPRQIKKASSPSYVQ